MANYTDKNAGDPWLAADGNALADDIGNPSTGHQHDGVEGHGTILPNAIGDGASITWDGRLLLDKGADLASGSTVTPGVDGNFFDITGTTTITAIATLQAGTVVIFQFDDAVQITHHATSLILEGGVNRTTEAKDIMMFLSLGSGNWQEISRSLVTPAVTHTIASHSDTTATGAETDTLTDGSDASSLHNHTVANLNDTGATGTELDTLTDGSDRDGLHTHPVYAKVASGTYTGDGAVSRTNAAGLAPLFPRLDRTGLAQIAARIPAARIVTRLRQMRLPARVSRDAGGYLCNATFYHLLSRSDLQTKLDVAGFVHVPADLPAAGTFPRRTSAEAMRLTYDNALIGAQEILSVCLGQPAVKPRAAREVSGLA